MIVPVDGHWLNLMMGKRFHENLTSNSNSENDSTCSYESAKTVDSMESEELTQESDGAECGPRALHSEPLAPLVAEPDISTSAPEVSTSAPEITTSAIEIDTRARFGTAATEDDTGAPEISTSAAEVTTSAPDIEAAAEEFTREPAPDRPPPSDAGDLLQCSVKLDKLPKEDLVDNDSNPNDTNTHAHTARLATMNLELSKLSTKNIIEHSKIMSLQHMNRGYNYYHGIFNNEWESSGDETSSRGTLDAIIPPLKDFQGKNNPFLMQNNIGTKGAYASHSNRHNFRATNGLVRTRHSFPAQPFPRTFKRKLSEKDIVIGPNGEVKRRKYRRPRKNQVAHLHTSV